MQSLELCPRVIIHSLACEVCRALNRRESRPSVKGRDFGSALCPESRGWWRSQLVMARACPGLLRPPHCLRSQGPCREGVPSSGGL